MDGLVGGGREDESLAFREWISVLGVSSVDKARQAARRRKSKHCSREFLAARPEFSAALLDLAAPLREFLASLFEFENAQGRLEVSLREVPAYHREMVAGREEFLATHFDHEMWRREFSGCNPE